MQPKEHTHTTKDLSSEEVKPSSIHLDERMKYRKVNSELLQRAWHIVHRIAAMLYKDFEASQVAVLDRLPKDIGFQRNPILILLSGEFKEIRITMLYGKQGTLVLNFELILSTTIVQMDDFVIGYKTKPF